MMNNLIDKIKLKYEYSIESIKNRYPCKIISFHYIDDPERHCEITYQYVTRLNLRALTLKELLDDKLLLEKFHPTDCVKLVFISAREILFKHADKKYSKEQFEYIIKKMTA